MATHEALEIALLRTESSIVVCPYCYTRGPTIIEYRAGLLTYLSCCCIALLGCVAGCCLVPFCINPLRDVRHQCGECRRYLWTYERI